MNRDELWQNWIPLAKIMLTDNPNIGNELRANIKAKERELGDGFTNGYCTILGDMVCAVEYLKSSRNTN